MARLLQVLALAALAISASGCATCASVDDCYDYYGGSWPRFDQCCGRVGSAFQPAGNPIIAPQPQIPPNADENPEAPPATRDIESNPGPEPDPNAAPVLPNASSGKSRIRRDIAAAQ